MKPRLTVSALAAGLALLVPAAAAAAPVTVNVRVEGATSTLFEAPVTTDGHAVDGGDGTGPHPCDGTNGGANPEPGATVTNALADAKIQNGWRGSWNGQYGDFLIDGIGGESGTYPSYWGTVVDFQPTERGGCQEQVHAGDDVLFALGLFGEPMLRLSGPAKAPLGNPVTFSVTDGQTQAAAPNATVAGSGVAALSGADGAAIAVFTSPGLVSLKASRDGAIRSNALNVCVSASGAGDCGAAPGSLGTPSSRSHARDSTAPVARISGPRDGARYRRGPRLLRGSAADDTGVSTVKLALRRHQKGRSCRWWSGRRERFVGHNCRKTFFFAVGDAASWSYLLPKRLGPGRYVLDVKAFDRARNRDERFVRGRNRVVFEVRGERSHSTRAVRRAATRVAGARVRVMVARRDGGLVGPRTVTARSARVRVGGRRCTVAASTPLAALAATLSTRRGGSGSSGRSSLGYHLRDFGSCSRRAADSAQLFVDRIGAEPNSGNDGWVYKVGRRAGSAGAADPAGAFGAGPLKAGAHVLWFYCLLGSRNSRCQPSLAARLVPRNAGAGESVSVSVRGYDDEGRGRPVTGATVALGPASASTGSGGRATLVLPAAGRYLLSATKPGSVPAFPVAVRVKA